MEGAGDVFSCRICHKKFACEGSHQPLVIPNGQTYCKLCLSKENFVCPSDGFALNRDVEALPVNKLVISLIESTLGEPLAIPQSSSKPLTPEDLLHILDTTELSVSLLQDMKVTVEKQLIVAGQRERETRRKNLIAERSECIQTISSCDKEITTLQATIISMTEQKLKAENRIIEINGLLAELKRDVEQNPSCALSPQRSSPETATITMDHIRNVTPINARYICPICGIACKSTTKLQNHAETEHNL